MKRQVCELKIDVAVEKRGPCGTFWYLLVTPFFVNYVKTCFMFK